MPGEVGAARGCMLGRNGARRGTGVHQMGRGVCLDVGGTLRQGWGHAERAGRAHRGCGGMGYVQEGRGASGHVGVCVWPAGYRTGARWGMRGCGGQRGWGRGSYRLPRVMASRGPCQRCDRCCHTWSLASRLVVGVSVGSWMAVRVHCVCVGCLGAWVYIVCNHIQGVNVMVADGVRQWM